MATYVVLEINSFREMSIGAVHYYGKLKGDKNGSLTHVDISKNMTQEEADWFNENDGYGSIYETGASTDRFNTKSEIHNEAIKIWREEFPDAEFLLEGNYAYAEPMYCVDARNFEDKVQLNNIYYAYSQIPYDLKNGYDRSEENHRKADVLWRQFRKVLDHDNI
jgi:hypothetical protein